MYDRETETEWKQPTGVAISGELAGSRLGVLPAPIVAWERFRAEHPDGIVLQPARGEDQSSRTIYDMTPYERYVEREAFGLYGMRGEGDRRSWGRTDLDAKTLVLGIEHRGEPVGYPTPWIEAAGGVVTDSVNGLDLVVFATSGGLHAFENPGYEFEPREGTFLGDGTTWDPISGESGDGRRLDRMSGRRLFAFAWQDAHGKDAFYHP